RNKEERILKEFVNNGGFILAEACCGKEQFDKDFRALVDRMFGEKSLQPLPKTHPVWTASGLFAVDPDEFPLEGVSQGCKTVLIYSRQPIAGYWEENKPKEGRGKFVIGLSPNLML